VYVARQELVPTEQAVSTTDDLYRAYLHDIEEQAKRVAREERGARVTELVPTDYEEADRRVRRRLGRKQSSPWGPVGTVCSGLAGVAFSQIYSGLMGVSSLSGQQAWWSIWWHSLLAIVLAVAFLLGAVLAEIRDHNAR
jgi:hypothetical protein